MENSTQKIGFGSLSFTKIFYEKEGFFGFV